MLPASYKTFPLYLVCKGEVKRSGDFCWERLCWSDSGPRSLLGSSGLHHRLLCAPQRRDRQWCNPAANPPVFTKPGDFSLFIFFFENNQIFLLSCVNMKLWSGKKQWRKNNPRYMLIISQQTFQQWVTVSFSQCLVLVKKKKKKKSWMKVVSVLEKQVYLLPGVLLWLSSN